MIVYQPRRVAWPALLLVAIFAFLTSTQAAEVTGPATVIEGDLIQVGETTLRLWGVDAAEPEQLCYRQGVTWPCGQRAIVHLRDLIGDRPVTCRMILSGATTFGRCRVMGLDLSAELANHGLALVPRDGPQTYILNHHDGRTHGAGMWSGLYVPPWRWREGMRVLEWISDIRGCALKGDISQDGRRIVYAPNQPAYSGIRIEASKGEKWFCSQEEALANGWPPLE